MRKLWQLLTEHPDTDVVGWLCVAVAAGWAVFAILTP
jgi:hypothetical protein